ncbi:Putative DMT superfamily metabolite efflux protein precursor [Klebsiella pneumoniae ISC21]|nr:Putative DMT superfamily metabolite efflux protein precursor [Klebsiella pneumoniae ISC21]
MALFGSRRPLDFVWVALAILGLWYLLPLGQNVAQVDLTGRAVRPRRRGVLGGLYSDRTACR